MSPIGAFTVAEGQFPLQFIRPLTHRSILQCLNDLFPCLNAHLTHRLVNRGNSWIDQLRPAQRIIAAHTQIIRNTHLAVFKLSKHQEKRVRIDRKYRLFPFRFAVEQCVDCLRHPRLRPADHGNSLVLVHAEQFLSRLDKYLPHTALMKGILILKQLHFFKSLLFEMQHHFFDQLVVPDINAAVRSPRKISRTQYHRRFFFTDRLIRFD